MIIPLEKKKLPDRWYNSAPDLPISVPPPLTGTGHPMGPHHLADIATEAIVHQELDEAAYEVRIPEPVRDLYLEWRPTPLFRAERWEEILGTPARVFYKYEGGSSAGSYEANTAIAQAYYASQEGVDELVTATANGEMGIALAIACNFFNLRCKVFMVRSGYESREYGRYIMELLGADVTPSPSRETVVAKEARDSEIERGGSLSSAISEAFSYAYDHEEVKFCWGTVMKHVALHHSIIGLEARLQMREAKSYPNLIVGAVGGGSGLAGLALPFFRDGRGEFRIVAAESAAAPSLSKGKYRYDYADAAGMSALYKMYTLGRKFVPPGIRAGGMRYHGISPLVSALYQEGEIEARIHTQREAFEAAVSFARAEGIVPTAESAYAIRVVMDEALLCKQSRQRKDILFMINANGNLDAATFKDFLEGAVENQPFLHDEVEDALKELPDVDTSRSS